MCLWDPDSQKSGRFTLHRDVLTVALWRGARREGELTRQREVTSINVIRETTHLTKMRIDIETARSKSIFVANSPVVDPPFARADDLHSRYITSCRYDSAGPTAHGTCRVAPKPVVTPRSTSHQLAAVRANLGNAALEGSDQVPVLSHRPLATTAEIANDRLPRSEAF
ncbi:unnamed protein product, partial [Iphiclides podalirius]